MALPTLQEMMNLYLYGQYTTIPNAPIRSIDAETSVTLKADEYMRDAAWYAVPAQFHVVNAFFNAPTGTFQKGRNYTFAEVEIILEAINPNKNYTQF